MKISLNWAQWYSNVDLKQLPLAELAKKIGAQLGALEEVPLEYGRRFDGVVVARVVSCVDHPDSDHLHVCMVDDGGATNDVERDEHGYVQVVCGAPNVREGLLVAWLPPKTTVPSTADKEPFVLDVRKIRGQLSSGMIASGKELGLNDDHDGILEIDPTLEVRSPQSIMNPQPGMPFKQLYGIDDVILDIENKMFTHRPDCFGHIGVARELAGIQGLAYQSPDWYLQPVTTEHLQPDNSKLLPFTVNNELPDLVRRFCMIAMSGVAIKPSPLWMQAGLSRVGLRPINNIVDITNYLMLLTGQPLHAFDYDKVVKASGEATETASVVVRSPRPGESIELLNGKTIEPRAEAIMIATPDQLIAVGGCMGGADTEVDSNTTNILIEVANFDMYSIRKTAMAHGLFTDAVARFNKGQSPLQNDRVLAKAVEMVRELAGGEVASQLVDLKTASVVNPAPVEVSPAFINVRLGLNVSAQAIKQTLENVEFIVTSVDEGDKAVLKITPPFWRTDIEIQEDIVEEVGRLIGFDHLPLVLPARDLKPAVKDSFLEQKAEIRHTLCAAGANEVLGYSFVPQDLLTKVGQKPELAYHIRNAISPELQNYRISLTPSLLEKVHQNIKADLVRSDDNEFALFEINKVHLKGQMELTEPTVPQEDMHVALVFAADDKTASRKYHGSAYYQALQYLHELLPKEGSQLVPLDGFELGDDVWAAQMIVPYEPKRSGLILREGVVWGVVGEYRARVRKALKLPNYSAGFELGVLIIPRQATTYTPLPTFPKTVQDLCLKVPVGTTYGQLDMLLTSEIHNYAKNEGIHMNMHPLDIYQLPGADTKNITFRLWLSHFNRTLKNDEVNTLLDKLAAVAGSAYQAERI